MSPLSEYFRLTMYPLLVLFCFYGILYFPHFRWVFGALAFFFALFGVGLLVLVLGYVEWNTWLRANLVPLAQTFLVVAFVRTMWRSHKWGGLA